MSETYLIRADASPKIGAGHVMRTLALGQMLRDHGQSVHYATTTTTRAILDRIADEGFVLHRMQGEGEIDGKMHDDSMYCLETARRIDAKWIILDGYQFGTSYQRSVKSSGFNLMCIDDMASCHIVADVVVNQNIKACDIRYSIEPYTRLYAGPHHALMRSEFIQEKGRLHRNPSRKIKNILVTMGASNIDTIILQVLKGLECSHLPRICIKAVLGSDQSHDDEIRSFIESSHHHIEFMRNVGPEMARLSGPIMGAARGLTCRYDHSRSDFLLE